MGIFLLCYFIASARDAEQHGEPPAESTARQPRRRPRGISKRSGAPAVGVVRCLSLRTAACSPAAGSAGQSLVEEVLEPGPPNYHTLSSGTFQFPTQPPAGRAGAFMSRRLRGSLSCCPEARRRCSLAPSRKAIGAEKTSTARIEPRHQLGSCLRQITPETWWICGPARNGDQHQARS